MSDIPEPSDGSRVRAVPRLPMLDRAGVYRLIRPTDDARRAGAPDSGFFSEAPAASTAEPDPSLSQGDVLSDRYVLDGELRRGGMGTVFRARDVVAGVDVAVKLLRHDVLVPMGSTRLLEEARSAARLRHPSVVRIRDFGETPSGGLFLVMELLEGGSLADVLAQRGRLAPMEAVRILLPIASALSMAHARGIVHRDVKPDNIMFTHGDASTRVPKLIDFGIAKLSVRKDADRGARGGLLGSPDYMAPEQIVGASEVDERADVWGLSMVLYETLHGRTAFADRTGFRVLSAIADESPVAPTEVADREPELWEILRKGLDKRVERRIRSMRALGRALARWAFERGVTTDVTGTSLVTHWLTPT